MTLTRRCLPLLSAGLAGLSAPHLRAQSRWPSRSVRIVVAFGAGGSADRIARLIQPHLAEFLGQSVVVENRSGGAGVIAAQAVASAPADGHTLLLEDASFLIAPLVGQNRPDSYGSFFTPVGVVAEMPLALVVSVATGVTDFAGYLDSARLARDPLPYGTTGVGSVGHVAGALLARRSGLRFEHVPYRGGADIARDLAAGSLPSGYAGTAALLPLAEMGRIRPIAVTRSGWDGPLGDVPSFDEVGFKDFNLVNWNALFVPTETPRDIRRGLEAAIAHATDQDSLRTILYGFGARPTPPEADRFMNRLERDAIMIRELVQEAGLDLAE